jgi:hypothetical protein
MLSCFAIALVVAIERTGLAMMSAAVRELAIPGDKHRLMDMRRSGVVEAIASDVGPLGLSTKLANPIDRSNVLHKTYAPYQLGSQGEYQLTRSLRLRL